MPLLFVLLALAALAAGGVAAVTVSGNRSAFLRLVANEVERQLGELAPTLSASGRRNAGTIIASMWAHESGFGTTRAWREGWNGGNVSRGSWVGPVIPGGDLEYAPGSTEAKRIRQEWRKYATLAEAVSDFFRLLSWTKYQPARTALFAGDAATFIEKLSAGGYFTAPVSSYRSAVLSILPDAQRSLIA